MNREGGQCTWHIMVVGNELRVEFTVIEAWLPYTEFAYCQMGRFHVGDRDEAEHGSHRHPHTSCTVLGEGYKSVDN